MNYQNWKWHNSATEEQMDSAGNNAAVERLAREAHSIFEAIYDPRDEYAVERFHDYIDGLDTEEERESALRVHSTDTARQWGEIDAIEQMMAGRGARFARNYEHHNEEERMCEYLENDS